MIREIVKSAKSSYTLNLPDDMIGKTVEVIAFEIKDQKSVDTKTTGESKSDTALKSIIERYSKYPSISHDGYQFSRDEANDYE